MYIAFILWDYECSYTACLQSSLVSVDTRVDSMYYSGR